ncbi:MAG: hypothetical protein ACE5KF_12840 [Kiloniellaceae bacterium]
MSGDQPPPRDGIYRAILWVMVATVVVGALLAVAGETLYQNPGLARFGAVVAFVGGAIYAVFRWLGRRETRRRAQARGAGPDDAEPGG